MSAEDSPERDVSAVPPSRLPEGWEDMTTAEREEWAERKRADLEEAVDDATRLDTDQQDALDALADPVEGEREEVDINGQSVTVKTYLNSEMEDAFDHISKHADSPQQVRGTLVDALVWLCEDDDRYGGERGRAVWERFAEEYGTNELARCFYAAADPVLERAEAAEAAGNSRGRT